MKSTDLVNQVNSNIRFNITQLDELSLNQGIYAIYDKGTLVYVGKSKASSEKLSEGRMTRRVGREHASGNSCVSSFCNYLRSEKGITISTEEVRLFPELAPVKIEELKVQDYLDSNITVSFVECDPDVTLEDVDSKPEDYLLRDYFPSKDIFLWNYGTKRSKKIDLNEYRKRLRIEK